MKNRVILIASEFPPGPGGIGQHVYSLAIGLNLLNYKVTVLTNSDYSLPCENAIFDSGNPEIEIIRFKKYFPIITQIGRFIKILTFLYTIKAEIKTIMATGRFPLIFMSLFGKTRLLRGIKKIGILHGSEINPIGILEKNLNQLGMINCDKLISVSNFTQNLLPEKVIKKFGKDNLYIIGNGITPVSVSRWENVTGKIDLNGTPKLLTVGNVIPRKGQHLVVNALNDLIIDFPKIHYHIVGIRRSTKWVDQSILENNLQSYCTFHGRVIDHQDLALFYKNVDVLMLLSENQPNGDVEGFGIVALEANYFGIPVVGSLGTGVETVVKHGFSGILVDANNIVEIKNALIEILNNKEHFKQESKKWAMNHHWDKLSLEFEKVINHN